MSLFKYLIMRLLCFVSLANVQYTQNGWYLVRIIKIYDMGVIYAYDKSNNAL